MANIKQIYFNKECFDKTFHPNWNWLKEMADNPWKTMCLMCRKSFHLSNMDIQAVRSHVKTNKHLAQVMSVENLKTYFKSVL